MDSFYPLLLSLHGILRWLVLASGIVTVATVFLLLVFKKPFRPAGRITGVIYTSLVDLQVLAGLLLLGVSPLVRAFWADPLSGMRVKPLRFFAVEHVTLMILALALVHIGAVRSRRASDDASACRAALLWYLLSLLLIAAGIPWWRA